MILQDGITETQRVSFILDSTPTFEFFDAVGAERHQKAIVVCDSKLASTWWPKIEARLARKTRIAHIEYLDALESSKNLKSFAHLVNVLSENKCSRDDLIVAIGGGTVLDIVGFTASTYMRGIPLLMIPTTLIGQADASTAGKTCLNTDAGKNLLGTLYLPRWVYNNVAFLQTCALYDQRQGFSEIFKYALLGSRPLLDLLMRYQESPSDDRLLSILNETIRVRMALRKKDPLASNFGHTFGHALEKVSNFAVGHGDAISVGMVMAMEFSVREGVLKEPFKREMVGWMRALGLNTKVEAALDADTLTDWMLKDKKSSNTQVRLVLIEEAAKPFEKNGSPFYAADPEVLRIFLRHFFKKNEYVAECHWQNLRKESPHEV